MRAATGQGVEVETQWAVTRDFRLGADVAYLDSHYVYYSNASVKTLESYCASSPGTYSATPQCAAFPFPVPGFRSAAGETTNYAPKWSGSVTASYRMLLPGGYNFSTELSPYFTSSYNEQDPYLVGTAG